MSITISVTKRLRSLFARSTCIQGHGGYQNLTRTLQDRIRGHQRATFDHADVERVHRYRENYGTGGFQQALVELDKELQDAISKKRRVA